MIIQLDDSLIKFLSDRKETLSWSGDELCALESIFRSVKTHKHILIASIHVIEFLQDFFSQESSFFNGSICHVLDYMYKHYTFLKSYKNYVTSFVLVCSSCTQVEREEDNGKIMYKVPLSLLSNCDVTKLCAENENDASFYKTVIKKIFYDTHKKINFDIAVETIGCGGSEMQHFISESKLDDQFTIFIIDSDKHFPEDKVGETARKASKEFNNHPCRVSSIHVLKRVGEMENLLSPMCYLYDKSCESIITQQDQKKFLSFFRDNISDHHDWWGYLDIKSGMTVKKYNQYRTSKEGEKFYTALFSNMNDEKLLSEGYPFNDCPDDFKIYNKIGQRTRVFLDEILPAIEKTDDSLWNLLPYFLQYEWKEISDMIYSFCCCFPQTECI